MKTLLLFLGMALTTACNGPSFQAGEEPQGAGESGAGGELTGTGGDSPAGTGGTPSQGGTAGASAGSAGASGAPETGGSEAGGASAAGGTETGGGAGSGSSTTTGGAAGTGGMPPDEPTCDPEDAIVFPESFTWDGFSTQWDDVDESYCGRSDGGLCTFRNVMLTYTTDGRLNAYANLDCVFTGTVAGVCGAETTCDSNINPRAQAAAYFTLVPDGDGYRLVDTGSAFGTFSQELNCITELSPGRSWSPGSTPTIDFRDDFMRFITSQRFGCP